MVPQFTEKMREACAATICAYETLIENPTNEELVETWRATFGYPDECRMCNATRPDTEEGGSFDCAKCPLAYNGRTEPKDFGCYNAMQESYDGMLHALGRMCFDDTPPPKLPVVEAARIRLAVLRPLLEGAINQPEVPAGG